MRLVTGRLLGNRGAHERPRPPGITPSVLIIALIVLPVLPTTALAVQSVPASRFEPTESCGCHGEFIDQWSGTMHAQALTDPIYRAKLAEANKATRGQINDFCETCHGPVAAMAGLLRKDAQKRPIQAREGVACDFCHQVTATGHPVADSSFIVRPDGVKRAALSEPASPYHRSSFSAFHETPEFCGTCHNVNHPGNGLALEATYTEWKQGPYAAKGIGCQDCHMTPGPGVKSPNAGRVAPFGVERLHVYTMTFVGANTTLGPKALAEERLRAAAEVRLEAPRVLSPGSPLDVVATVTNVGAGHYIPTGTTDLRRMRLEVVGVDAGGREVLREERVFGTTLADAEGRSPAEPWEAVAVATDDRIAPSATATETYALTMPEKGPVTISATLRYQGVPDELAAKAGVQPSVTEMATTQAMVYTTEESLKAAEDENSAAAPCLLPVLTVLGMLGMLAMIGAGALSRRRRTSV